MSVTAEGLTELRGSLLLARRRIVDDVEQVVSRGALNIKRGMAESARVAAPVHAPYFPQSISYDVVRRGSLVEAEIGPDKARLGRQGALGNLLAFGSKNNAPVWRHDAALLAEADPFADHVGAAAERLLQ